MTSLDSTTEIEFYEFIGFLHAEMQRLKGDGMQGYYLIVGQPHAPSLSLTWTFFLFDQPSNTAESLMEPIAAYLNERKHLFAYTQSVSHANSYFNTSSNTQNEAVATGGSAYGSRLLSPQSLSNANTTAKVFAEIGPRKNPVEAPLVRCDHFTSQCKKQEHPPGPLTQPDPNRSHDCVL